MTDKPHSRTKPAEVRRDELMNAAESLFLAQGLGATTIEQITDGAAIAKGTFYLYFSSKEDLRAALGERYGQDHLAAIVAAIAERPSASWAEKLAIWAKASVAFYLDSIARHDVLFADSRPPTREGLVDNSTIDYLCRLLEAGAEAKAWSIDDARFTAVFLFSGLHGSVDDAVTKEKRINRARLIRRVEEMCFRAVGWPQA